jgi:hypothetical protein
LESGVQEPAVRAGSTKVIRQLLREHTGDGHLVRSVPDHLRHQRNCSGREFPLMETLRRHDPSSLGLEHSNRAFEARKTRQVFQCGGDALPVVPGNRALLPRPVSVNFQHQGPAEERTDHNEEAKSRDILQCGIQRDRLDDVRGNQ